jgi:pimeloyl-ACP methyl ester carboxylesterase
MADFLRSLGKILLWALVLFLLVLLGLYLGQGYFVYPGRALYRGESPEWQARTANVHVSGFTPVQFSQEEGAVEIRGLWRPTHEGSAPLMLWFHDRDESVTEILHQLRPLQDLEIHIYAMEYRGYGQSAGNPSQKDLVADAERAFDDLVGGRADVWANAVYAGGWGLGAALAVDLAGRRPIRAVVAFAPFSNIEDVFSRQLPYMPSHLVLRDSWDAKALLQRGTCPVYVVYGTESKIPPAEQSRAWKIWGDSRVTLRPVEGASEEDLLRKAGPGLYEDIGDFLIDAGRW